MNYLLINLPLDVLHHSGQDLNNALEDATSGDSRGSRGNEVTTQESQCRWRREDDIPEQCRRGGKLSGYWQLWIDWGCCGRLLGAIFVLFYVRSLKDDLSSRGFNVLLFHPF